MGLIEQAETPPNFAFLMMKGGAIGGTAVGSALDARSCGGHRLLTATGNPGIRPHLSNKNRARPEQNGACLLCFRTLP